MTPDQIKAALDAHREWRADPNKGKRADLAGANLADADLAGADLAGAYLAGANLARADLAGANLARADGIIDLGQRADGYRFILHQAADSLGIVAGCRCMSVDEARAHWGGSGYRDRKLGDEALARIEAGLVIARIHGWEVP